MAFASINSIGTGFSKVAGTTVTIVIAAVTVEVGNLIVVGYAGDNLGSGADGDPVEVTSITDTSGNTYTKVLEYSNTQGAAGAGVTGSLWYSIVSTQIAAAGVITANLSGALTAKAITAWEFTVGAGSTISIAATTQVADDAADPSTLTISGLSSIERLYVAVGGLEATDSANYTKDTNYTALTRAGTGNVATVSNIQVVGGFRILTGTGDTYNATTGGQTPDGVQVYAALTEVAAATDEVSACFQSSTPGVMVFSPGQAIVRI